MWVRRLTSQQKETHGGIRWNPLHASRENLGSHPMSFAAYVNQLIGGVCVLLISFDT